MTSSLTGSILLSMWTLYTHYIVDHYVLRPSNSDKNSRRSILNVMMSPLSGYAYTPFDSHWTLFLSYRLTIGNNPLSPVVSEIFSLKYEDIHTYITIHPHTATSTDNKKCLKLVACASKDKWLGLTDLAAAADRCMLIVCCSIFLQNTQTQTVHYRCGTWWQQNVPTGQFDHVHHRYLKVIFHHFISVKIITRSAVGILTVDYLSYFSSISCFACRVPSPVVGHCCSSLKTASSTWVV